jgi:Ca2+-transporting ATPase
VVALAGIVDPARPEAKLAIAECRSAGIRVKMITGDHAATATAIGSELGLDGAAVSGADLDAMSDDDLRARIDEISVFARVAPEHKMRLVQALQAKGNVVAMTGDGVNDAPALKAADMGVAMGITGTEVTKEAATMVLADDNFSTIVRAVRQGRTIYDNIVSFIRFQLGTTLGFSVAFLGASLFNIAGAKPFTALQILWVNLIMDGPPAMALGVDPMREDAMDKPPRPREEQILTRSRLSKLLLVAAVMGVGTLAVLHLAPSEVAGTMGFTTFVAFQFFNILNARDDRRTVFRRSTLTNRSLWLSLLAVALLQVAAVHLGPLQSLFETTSLSLVEWLVCLSVSSSILWVEEVRKLLVRAVRPGSTPRTLDVDRVAEPAGR